MTEYYDKYYCVTDNDIYPPKLNPDWLSQMISIMEKYPKLGMLAPQLPPQYLQQPYEVLEDIVKCKAVGNTFTLIRREAFPLEVIKNEQKLFAFGDDGLISYYMRKNNWEIAFCRNIFCYHAGQCENWGYKVEEIKLDPRKQGYGIPFKYDIVNEETFEPCYPYKI
jgi:GT2 family glycosyltransferase